MSDPKGLPNAVEAVQTVLEEWGVMMERELKTAVTPQTRRELAAALPLLRDAVKGQQRLENGFRAVRERANKTEEYAKARDAELASLRSEIELVRGALKVAQVEREVAVGATCDCHELHVLTRARPDPEEVQACKHLRRVWDGKPGSSSECQDCGMLLRPAPDEPQTSPQITRRVVTEEDRKFWEHVDRCQEIVAEWPAWKREALRMSDFTGVEEPQAGEEPA